MNKLIIIVLVAFLLSVGQSTSIADSIRITGAVWCPNNCYPNKFKPGIMLEIVEKSLLTKGIDIQYTELPWSRAIMLTRNGEFDALIGASKSDAPDFIFPNEPIAIARNCFYTRNDQHWQYTGIASLVDISLVIGKDETLNDAMKKYINDKNSNESIVVLTGTDYLERLARMLASGRITTLVADVNVFNYLINNMGLSNVIKNAGCMPESLNIYLAFSPQKYTDLSPTIRLFNEGFKELKRGENNNFVHILDRYGAVEW